MIIIITGAVTVGGQRFPVTADVDLPDEVVQAAVQQNQNHLRAIPKAS